MNQIKRYDIILVDLGEPVGSEQGGKRPAVVIQNNTGNYFSDSTIIMPLTTKIDKNPGQPTHTLLKKGIDNGLACDSMVLGECMRQISKKRIVKYIGSITSEIEKKEIKRVYDASFGE